MGILGNKTTLGVGDIVKSLKGHDIGRIYVVIAAEEPFVKVVDGVYRKTANPKTKRVKHLELLGKTQFRMDDTVIKTAIKSFLEEQNVERG